MAPKYRLLYFDVRGLGESIRFLFAHLKIDYEDVRFPHDGGMSAEWKKLKPKQPFGKVPVLEVDGEAIAEARAIGRYIAREYGLAGKNNLEAAKCDMIVSALRDFNENRWKVIMEQDPAKKEELKKVLLDDEVPRYCEGLMKQMKNSQYLVGDSLTWADITVANTLYEFRNDFPEVCKQEKYKSLNEHVDRIHNLPGIKDWMAKRPKTQF
uniref:glutathione transferase n=1 Tax=Strigamia maritima TaxID=126957 RepID=T1JF51_STRMM